MCGIAGWVSYKRLLHTAKDQLEAMSDTVICRGPDAGGVWTCAYAALGHRRLAIIDRQGGGQPMVIDTADGQVALTYCGEVYNFRTLRRRLIERGQRFISDSDTEVVLRGYLEWGSAVACELNGMFAFAIADTRTRSLLMVRDRLGIKPLYYFQTNDGLLFGSEPKVIFAHPQSQRSVDLAGLRQVLAPVKVPGEAIWKGMKELRPGTTILVKENGIHENRYWNLKAAPHTEDPEETVVAVRSLLLNAVAEHLVADVPTCVLLSGGLDSSAIAALTAETLAQGDTVRTFALDLIGDGLFTPDPLRDTADPPFADRVARHLRSDHKVVSLDYRAILNPNVRQITVGARDSPGLGDMDQSLYLLFNTIHSHASVALSGESADEVFGGYQQFDRDAALSPTFPWMDRGNPGAAALSLMPPDLVEKLAMKEYLDDTYSEAVMHVPRHDEDTDTDRQMRERSYLYIAHFLPLLLDRKDRMSMAASIEIRVPFCDHRLIEYVFNVPWSIKTIDGREKGLLRRSVEDLLPNEVLHRKKSVYPCLHGLDYLTALQEQVRSVVDSPNHRLFELFERRAVAATVSTPPDQLRTKHRLAFEYMLEVGAWLQLRNPSFVMA